MKIQRVIPAFVLMAIVGFAHTVNAATIDYANVDAETLMFIDISENTTTAGELFGQPSTPGGDRLDFDPTQFEATTDGGSEIVDSQLSFTVMAKPGQSISNITFSEDGDYALAGLGDAAASAEVSTNIFWEVVEIDGSAIAPLSGNGVMVFSPSDGTYALGADPNVDAFDGFLDVDVAGFVAGEGINGAPTKVEFTLNNTLLVAAANGGTAFIKKKDFDGLVINIPEPSTAVLLGFGLAGLGMVRRRRR